MAEDGLAATGGPVNPSSARSVDSLWSSAEEMPSGYKHRDMLLSQMKLLLKRFNGPMEYLQSRYATHESKEQYADELWRQFPP